MLALAGSAAAFMPGAFVGSTPALAKATSGEPPRCLAPSRRALLPRARFLTTSTARAQACACAAAAPASRWWTGTGTRRRRRTTTTVPAPSVARYLSAPLCCLHFSVRGRRAVCQHGGRRGHDGRRPGETGSVPRVAGCWGLPTGGTRWGRARGCGRAAEPTHAGRSTGRMKSAPARRSVLRTPRSRPRRQVCTLGSTVCGYALSKRANARAASVRRGTLLRVACVCGSVLARQGW
jgi:hypothetical protein